MLSFAFHGLLKKNSSVCSNFPYLEGKSNKAFVVDGFPFHRWLAGLPAVV